jgi:hypothetical protein
MAAEQIVTKSKLICAVPWRAYVVPMALFMALTYLEGRMTAQYVWLYIGKVGVVTAALVACRAAWKDIRLEARVVPISILVGLAVFAEWVLIPKIVPYPPLGSRVGFNPFESISDPVMRGLFLAFRIFGLAVMVPVMEELFWRSFLLRYFTSSDYAALPVGTFSWSAFAIVAAGFGLAHPEWLVAVVCACAYGLLLRQTKSLFACILAHAVTNLALGIYVLIAKDWPYW